MKTGVIIITHGLAGIEMLKTCEMILGEQEHALAIGLSSEDTVDDLTSELSQTIHQLEALDYIVCLVDLQGGTPFNVAMKFKEQFKDIICGFNIPLLLDLLQSRHFKDIESLVIDSINVGKENLKCISEIIIQETDEEF